VSLLVSYSQQLRQEVLVNKYIVGFFIIFSSSLSAQDQPSLQCGAATNIYFGNGIKTIRKNAELTTELLRKAYESSLEQDNPGSDYEFATAYNQTIGAFEDIREVFLQRPAQQGTERDRLTPQQLQALIQIDEGRLQQLQPQ